MSQYRKPLPPSPASREAARDLSSDAALEAWASSGQVETLQEWRERLMGKPAPPENIDVR